MPDAVAELVDRHAAARARVSDRVQALVRQLWRGFDGHYSDAAVMRFTGQVARIVRAGQGQTAGLTRAYLLRALGELGAKPRRPRDLALPAGLRTGVSVEEEFERIVRGFRFERSRGVTVHDAREHGQTRALLVADTDLSLAMREASRQTLADVPEVLGYRRVIHPELSKGGTCGLCVVASDRLYSVAELLPLHDRCNCTTLPIVGDSDPGHRLNTADLKAIYAAAGSTGAADLKRTRYAIRQHGELGPVLVDAAGNWRDPAKVAADTGA